MPVYDHCSYRPERKGKIISTIRRYIMSTPGRTSDTYCNVLKVIMPRTLTHILQNLWSYICNTYRLTACEANNFSFCPTSYTCTFGSGGHPCVLNRKFNVSDPTYPLTTLVTGETAHCRNQRFYQLCSYVYWHHKA